MRPALRAVSRCPAVSLLIARKLMASMGISSTSPACRNSTGMSKTAARRCRTPELGVCRPFSYADRLRTLTSVAADSSTRVRPRRLRARTSRLGVNIAWPDVDRMPLTPCVG